MKSQLQIAVNIAEKAHCGQFRRDGITPYIEHPRQVADMLTYEDQKCVAWLHDVIEDTQMTMEDLGRMGVRPRIAIAVSALTKREGMTYTNYLHQVKSNDLATVVKIADMLCNLLDSPTQKQIEKYKQGLMFLCLS